MKKRILNKNEVDNIIEIFSGGIKSVSKIYRLTGISPKLIRRELLNNGYNTNTLRTYSVDETIFQNIDSEEKAYWLGFLYADGSVRKIEKKGHFEMRLWISIKDEPHLWKFKSFLQSEHPIKYRTTKIKYKNSFSISEGVGINICSKKMVEDLFKLGCIQNKTCRLFEPEIKKELFCHFIRGYFDGDGCMSIKKNNSGKVIDFSSSSKNILMWISDIFKIHDVEFCDLFQVKNHYRLRNSKIQDIIKIYKFMYEGSSIFLKRKEIKFIEAIEYFRPKKVIQKNYDNSNIKIWNDIVDASRELHIKKILILKSCDKKIKFAGGYKWEYYDLIENTINKLDSVVIPSID